jgi:hypothetical protein
LWYNNRKGGIYVKKTLILVALAALLAGLACEEATEDGKICGNVKDNGTAVSGAFVLLLEEGKMLGGEDPLSNGSITGTNGNYTILLVQPDKDYYIVAVKDEDGNQEYTPGVDPIGYHGKYNSTTKVWVPTVVRVSSGQTLTGINVSDMVIVPVVP